MTLVARSPARPSGHDRASRVGSSPGSWGRADRTPVSTDSSIDPSPRGAAFTWPRAASNDWGSVKSIVRLVSKAYAGEWSRYSTRASFKRMPEYCRRVDSTSSFASVFTASIVFCMDAVVSITKARSSSLSKGASSAGGSVGRERGVSSRTRVATLRIVRVEPSGWGRERDSSTGQPRVALGPFSDGSASSPEIGQGPSCFGQSRPARASSRQLASSNRRSRGRSGWGVGTAMSRESHSSTLVSGTQPTGLPSRSPTWMRSDPAGGSLSTKNRPK